MNIRDCFELRILRKIEFDSNKIETSVKIANKKLAEARELFNSKFYTNAVLNAYTSMFHIARALLYKDCIQEKSHFAVYIYLNEKYSNQIPKSLLNLFNSLRDERHAILYGVENDLSIDYVENILSEAKSFLEEVKKILK